MRRYTRLIALAVSILSWYVFAFALSALFDRLGMPIYIDSPVTRLALNLEEHRFDEEVVNGRSTGTGDAWIILTLVFSRLVYKLVDTRSPISRGEKRWLIYASVGFAVWAISGEFLRASVGLAPGSIRLWVTGEWLDTPLDPRVVTYIVRKGLHLLLGVGIIGICRWDYVRTFRPTEQPPKVGPDSHES